MSESHMFEANELVTLRQPAACLPFDMVACAVMQVAAHVVRADEDRWILASVVSSEHDRVVVEDILEEDNHKECGFDGFLA